MALKQLSLSSLEMLSYMYSQAKVKLNLSMSCYRRATILSNSTIKFDTMIARRLHDKSVLEWLKLGLIESEGCKVAYRLHGEELVKRASEASRVCERGRLGRLSSSQSPQLASLWSLFIG